MSLLFLKIRNKIGKITAQYFPMNRIRVWGLKICGFKIGTDVYIGSDLVVASMISEKTCWLRIEDRVAIGPRVTLILSSDANNSKLMKSMAPIRGGIKLEEDVWVGAGAIIMPNVVIGRMSIIGAGTIVTKSVPPFSVVIGSPGRISRSLNPGDFL